MLTRRPVRLAAISVLCVSLLALSGLRAATDTLPSQLTDQEFWKLSSEFSEPDGFFRSGDIGLLTPLGALVITGRKKDLIIRGGENISAKEIEDVLHLHPGVREAAVVAMPHARLGEGVCAFIVLCDGEAPEARTLSGQVLASGLARQKCPERFEFVADLPRTASGKVRKDVLREEIRQRLATEAEPAS